MRIKRIDKRDSFAPLREVVVASLLQRSNSLMASSVGFLVCLVVLGTAGQSAVTRDAVLSTVDKLSTTLVVVTDNSGDGRLDSDLVGEIRRLNQAEWAFGLGDVRDARSADAISSAFGVPMRPIVGVLPGAIRGERGRAPLRDYEAWVGHEAFPELRMEEPVGTVVVGSQAYGIVGVFDVGGPLSSLNGTILARIPEADVDSVRFIYANAVDTASAPLLGRSIEGMLPADARATTTVEMGSGAVALKDALAGRLDGSARNMLLIVLGIGLVLSAVVTYIGVTSRRRDFGRRRALGATRSILVGLILAQNALCTSAGAVLGATGGLVLINHFSGSLPGVPFVVGVCALTVLSSIIGGILPAVGAAYSDPVRILRIP